MRTIYLFSIVALLISACATSPKGINEETKENLTTTPFNGGVPITIEFERGKEYYHPLIVFWIEDMDNNFVETIYATSSIATGTFRYGQTKEGKWQPGERRRPAALPYWGHRRGKKAPDGLYLPSSQNPLPDAITGATPRSSFVINSSVRNDLRKFKIYMEINQTWDWNKHWHNNLFPDDEEYKTSCQPALVYMAEVDLSQPNKRFVLQPVGHSHPSGKTGELFKDLSTFTTALLIAKEVSLTVKLE